MTESTEHVLHHYRGKTYKAVPLNIMGQTACANCDFRNDDSACVDAPDCTGINWKLADE